MTDPTWKAQTLRALVKRIGSYQYRTSQSFRFVVHPERIAGLFVSYPTYHIVPLRRFTKRSFAVRVPENNAFSTMWTLDLLLEAFEEDPRQLAPINLEQAVRACLEFHDMTRERDDPLFMFWKQRDLYGIPAAFPVNLLPWFRLFMTTHRVRQRIRRLLTTILPFGRASRSSPHGDEPVRDSGMISLPADLDDSALNWSLGSRLRGAREACPEAWSAWSEQSFDFGKLARHAVACAYRPFSPDPDVNAIDPRSFYVSRDFLWNLAADHRAAPDFGLLTTWSSTFDENLAGIERYYKMPFNTNNLDCGVQANVIHASLHSVRDGRFPHEVEGFESLLLNTVEYLAWCVTSGTIVDRPDLALLYYPMPQLAFFLISRIIALLITTGFPGNRTDYPEEAGRVLLPATRDEITRYLLARAQTFGGGIAWTAGSFEAGEGASRVRRAVPDDRRFVTALSIMTILNLWTTSRHGAPIWSDQTPDEIPGLIEESLSWLREHALFPKNTDHNVIFSASVKAESSLPFRYPANVIRHVRGPILPTRLSQKQPSLRQHGIFAMSGVPSPAEYTRLLESTGYPEPTPGDLKRCYELMFPYWSAPSVTGAMICLALARGDRIER